MKKWTISFFLMASNGMKFIYLKKQQNTPTKVFIFLILIMFLLEHAKKTARTVSKKKKSLWKTANYSTKTLLKRIKDQRNYSTKTGGKQYFHLNKVKTMKL